MYLTNTLIIENSELILNFKKEYPNEDYFNQSNMSSLCENIINSVNKSQVNKENVNEIISFLDYLMVNKKIIRDFIIDNITKSLEGVEIDDYHQNVTVDNPIQTIHNNDYFGEFTRFQIVA